MPFSTPEVVEELLPLQCAFGDYVMGRRGVELVEFGGYDLPAVTVHDVRRGSGHGQFRGRDTLGGASWTVTLELWPDSEHVNSSDGVSIDDFLSAFSVDVELPFVFRPHSGWTRWRMARVSSRVGPLLNVEQTTGGVYAAAVAFHSTEPGWIFDPRDAVLAPFVGGSPTGVTVPFSLPAELGMLDEGQGIGSLIATNRGNLSVAPSIQVHGPVSGFSLVRIHEGQTAELEFNTTLVEGQVLHVDFGQHTVTLDGQSRYHELADPSGWWDLPSGQSELRFVSDANTGRAAVNWASLWV